MEFILIIIIIFLIYLICRRNDNYVQVTGLSRDQELNYYRCILYSENPILCSSYYFNNANPKQKFGNLDCAGDKYSLYKQCNLGRMEYYYSKKTDDELGEIHTKIDKKHGDLLDGNSYNINGLGICKANILNDNIFSCRNIAINPSHLDKSNVVMDNPYLYNPYLYRNPYNRGGIQINNQLRNSIGTINDNATNKNYLLFVSYIPGSGEYTYYTMDKDENINVIQKLNRNVNITDGHIFEDKLGNKYTFKSNNDGNIYF